MIAHTADNPVIFMSDQYRELVRLAFQWHDHGTFVRYQIDEDSYNLKLCSKIIRQSQCPRISEQPEQTLLHCMAMASRLTQVRTTSFPSERHPDVRRVEVCLKADVARGFFAMKDSEHPEVEPGWLLLAAREIAEVPKIPVRDG